MTHVSVGALKAAPILKNFVEAEALPGTGIAAGAFWNGLAAIVAQFAPRNRMLLDARARLQAQIDAWHTAHPAAALPGDDYKNFLTRIGYGSSAVVTGDASQIDLIEKQTSGLTHAARILEGLEGVSVVRFEEVDVVRHPLVRRVVAAYDRQEALEREQELQEDPYQRERGYRFRPDRGPRFENRGWSEPRDWRPEAAAPPAPAAVDQAAEQTGEEPPKVEPLKPEGEAE